MLASPLQRSCTTSKAPETTVAHTRPHHSISRLGWNAPTDPSRALSTGARQNFPRTTTRSRLCTRTAAAGRPGATSASSQALAAECKALEAERDTAISTAESCAKTATKLTEMARLLEQLALEKVRNGDERGARDALREKAQVQEALDKNADKADANYQLAAVLSSKIAEKQAAMLKAAREAAYGQPSSAFASPRSRPAATPTMPTGPSYAQPSYPQASLSSSSAAAGDMPKWKWQASLENARERLRAQEAEAAREGRMARLSAESSITEAKQRIASRAQASVSQGLERLRDADTKSQSTLEAARARLRARDEEVLSYVRRVMARYRRGEYVSEDELEFAFQQLEKRFMA